MDRHTKSTLRRELQRAEEERDRLAVVIAYLRERLQEDDVRPEENGSVAKERPARRASTGTARVTAADATEQVLRENGRPMRTPDLLPEIQAKGAKMKNTDNLFRTLVGNPTFRKVGRGVWALAEWPTEESEDEPG